jgi:hypothetical protein
MSAHPPHQMSLTFHEARKGPLSQLGISNLFPLHFYNPVPARTYSQTVIPVCPSSCKMPSCKMPTCRDIFSRLTSGCTAIPKAYEANLGRCSHNEVPRTLVTPGTSVTAEALLSLQNFIIRQDACTLDETSKQSLQRYVQKFVNAAQTSLRQGRPPAEPNSILDYN